ncbi:hypothetical protein [Hoeflea sp. TYP-13]|uniref:hypothetical protein n=1 Tax=Hoeflea sp. TYP-13 TaxID=3230023 RepID=UPI0034C6BA98
MDQIQFRALSDVRCPGPDGEENGLQSTEQAAWIERAVLATVVRADLSADALVDEENRHAITTGKPQKILAKEIFSIPWIVKERFSQEQQAYDEQ